MIHRSLTIRMEVEHRARIFNGRVPIVHREQEAVWLFLNTLASCRGSGGVEEEQPEEKEGRVTASGQIRETLELQSCARLLHRLPDL